MRQLKKTIKKTFIALVSLLVIGCGCSTAAAHSGGEWNDTVPTGTFRGPAYWIQDIYNPWVSWERDPIQYVGEVQITLADGEISGWMDLPVDSVFWGDRINYPVRFYDEWWVGEQCRDGCWLFRVFHLGTKSYISTGDFGQYNDWNIHAQWAQGISYLWERMPETGLQFRWRVDPTTGLKHVKAFGFWTAWPSMHYMSIGWDLREVRK